MNTINNDIKNDKNRKIIDAINYLCELLMHHDNKLYSQFVDENLNNELSFIEIYSNLLVKLKEIQFINEK